MSASQNKSLRYLIKNTLVPHSQFKEAIEALKKLYMATVEDEYVDGLYITGATGIGKTFIREKFLDLHKPYDTEDRTVIPIVSFSMPTAGEGKGIYQAALAAMDSRYLAGTETALGQRLVALLKACRTQMVFVDEAQHFVQRNGRKSQERAADNLKTLMNEAAVSVILMGIDPLSDLMNVNEQLRRRFSTKVKLREWSPYDEADLGEVARIFKTFMQDPQIDVDYQKLLNADFVTRLIYGSGGRIGFIVKLLIEASMLAKEKGQKELSMQHFEKVFRSAIWDKATAKTNPFNDKFEAQELTGPNQPFWVAA